MTEKKPQFERHDSFEPLRVAKDKKRTESNEQIEQYADKGLDLFYGTENRASLTDLSEKQDNWESRRRGLDDVTIYGNNAESSAVWSMIRQPSTDRKVIITRQAVIERLSRHEKTIYDLWKARNAGYRLEGTLEYLFKVDENEQKKQEQSFGKYKPKTRIETIIEEGVTAENYLERISNAKIQVHEASDEKRPILEAMQSLENIETAIPATRTFIEQLRKLDNQTLGNIASELEILVNEVPNMDIATFLTCYSSGNLEEIELVKQEAQKISSCMVRIGALLSVALFVRENECGKATFNESEPRNYSSGWNALKKKSGSRDYEARKDIDQVLNDSPSDNPITILSGSNMSGKTFFMRQDMYIQLWSQAFGYIPASEGNFPALYNNFVYVDRASTDSANNLSAFGKEIDLWKKGLENCKGETCLYADEAFSTTSPEDQYKLLSATVLHLRSNGVRVTMANHNEEFLKRFTEHSEAGIYHFTTDSKENGDIDFLHKLQEGIDESHALEVARRMKMPAAIVKHAETYINGESVEEISQTPDCKPIEVYSEQERQTLKEQASSFEVIIPNADELISTEHDTVRRDSTLRWRELEENHYIRDDQREPIHRNYSWDEEEDVKQETEVVAPEPPKQFFVLLSNDSDFCYRFAHGKMGGVEHQKLLEFVQSLILKGANSDSKELHERQRMFAELATDKRYAELSDKTNAIWRLMWAAMNTEPNCFDGFNVNMLNGAHAELVKDYSNRVDAGEMIFYLATVKMNADLLDLDLKELGIEELMAKTLDFSSLAKKFKNLKYSSYSSDDNEERMRVNKEYHEKRTRLLESMFSLAGLEYDQKNDYEYTRAAKKLINEIHGTISPHVQEISLTDENIDSVALRIEAMKEEIETAREGQIFTMNSGLHIALSMGALLDTTPHVQNLLDKMRSFDSVHLHQLAHYFERILGSYFHGAKTGRELLTKHNEAGAEDKESWEEDSKVRQLKKAASHENFERVTTELTRLMGLCSFAQVVHEDEYTPVEFNDSGRIQVNAGWNMVESKDKQIKNDTQFQPDERTHLITGTNMSGKTFHLKRDIFAQLCAHATGFAPAESMTTPIFDRVMYLDRVNTNQDQNLSAFGNEVEHWKTFLAHMSNGEKVFAAVDEAFSTTSPRYQDALTFAVSRYMHEQGQTLSIASHNHDFISRFSTGHSTTSSAHHFKTHLDDEGGISFDYEKRQGHELSNALLVAKKQGVPDEILQLAKII